MISSWNSTRLGYLLRRIRSPEHALVAVKAATDLFLDNARGKLIQQKLVPREAARTLLSRMNTNGTDTVMTGRAGAGKTACVVEVVEGLRLRGLPVLAFRLDRVLSASNTTDLGCRLDLEESPVLMLAAAAEAAASPGFLIVDQLDAVSTISGRSSGAFGLVERLLHEARGTRLRATIHTIVVCRAFDWKNDSRLRKLIPNTQAQVDVTEFPVDEVRNNSGRCRLRSGAVSKNANWSFCSFLRTCPSLSKQALTRRPRPHSERQQNSFDRYWDEKRRRIEARAELSGDHWMEVVEILCDEMTSTQELSVPQGKAGQDPHRAFGPFGFGGRDYLRRVPLRLRPREFLRLLLCAIVLHPVGITGFVSSGVGATSLPARSSPGRYSSIFVTAILPDI